MKIIGPPSSLEVELSIDKELNIKTYKLPDKIEIVINNGSFSVNEYNIIIINGSISVTSAIHIGQLLDSIKIETFNYILNLLFDELDSMYIKTEYIEDFNLQIKKSVKKKVYSFGSSGKSENVGDPFLKGEDLSELTSIITKFDSNQAYHLDESNFIELGSSGAIATKDLRTIIYSDVDLPYYIKYHILSMSVLVLGHVISENDFIIHMRKVYEKYGLFDTNFEMHGGITFTKGKGFEFRSTGRFFSKVRKDILSK